MNYCKFLEVNVMIFIFIKHIFKNRKNRKKKVKHT